MKTVARALGRVLPFACMAALCSVALWQGVRATRGIDWPDPFQYDPLRDIGIAQSMLDGRYPEDHLYLNEIQWYNPGVAAMAAAGSWLTGSPPHVVDARLGAYANILVPVGFFFLAARLFDPWVAVAGLTFFLFAKAPLTPAWMAATYSPWLLATNFAQFPLYVALLLYWAGRTRNRRAWFVGAGVFLGITFLYHTGAAVLFGGVVVLMLLGDLWQNRRAGAEAVRWDRLVIPAILLLTVAFVVSLPYTGPILWRYQFRILNEWPTYYYDPSLSLARLPGLLRQRLTVPVLLGIVGLAALVRAQHKRPERRLLLCWLVIAAGFLLYSYVWQGFEKAGVYLPQIVPSFHFLLLLSALWSLLSGYGVGVVAGAVAGFAYRGWLAATHVPKNERPATHTPPWARGVAVFLGAAAAFCAYYPAYGTWPMFTRTMDRQAYAAHYADRAPAYDWIIESTRPADVFLCREKEAVAIVGPAGRKVVCTMLFYANLYVNFQQRHGDRDALFEALHTKEQDTFRGLARKYQVAYLLVAGDDIALVERAGFDCVTPAWRCGETAIYRVCS